MMLVKIVYVKSVSTNIAPVKIASGKMLKEV